MAPELQTVSQSVPGFEADSWNGLIAPAGTPLSVIAQIQAAIAKFVHDKDIVERFAAMGAEPVGNATADFAAFLKWETVHYTRLVKEANIKIE